MKILSKLLKSEDGFSIIEILLVVLVVGFIVILITNLPSSIKLIGDSHYSSVANSIASQEIESIRSQTYDNLANETATPFSDSRISSLPSGQGLVTISDCPVTLCTNSEQAKEVSVTVSWIEKPINAKSVTLTTIVAEGGLK